MADQHNYAPGETVPISFDLSRVGSGGISGQTVVCQMRKVSDPTSYLDFNDNTFKTSGWTTKQKTLAGVAGAAGFYVTTLNTALVAAIVDGFIMMVEVYLSGANALVEEREYRFKEASGGGGGATVDDFLDEPLADHTIPGSVGEGIALAAAGGGGGGSGDGSVTVTHDTGGADNLAWKNSLGQGVNDAQVRAYLKSDWDAGNSSALFIQATAQTDVNGRWVEPMFLDPETYTFVFEKQGVYQVATKEQAVA